MTIGSNAALRPVALPAISARDAVRLPAKRLLPRPAGLQRDALHAAITWLVKTHAVTGRQGSSKGFSLVRGWLPAYPETTGYVIGTLLDYSRRTGDDELARRAREMADWEVTVQSPDGGVMEGTIATDRPRSIVFNTGMVLHGYMDMIGAGGSRFEEAAVKAGRFLVTRLRPDGTWDPAHEYSGIPHTYNSRVSWAMIRLALHWDDEELLAAARRQLDWATGRQRGNGWFESCVFKPGMLPSTHGIAYTLRGLLESHVLVDEPRYLDSVVRAAEVLIRKLEVLGRLPADWDSDWTPRA